MSSMNQLVFLRQYFLRQGLRLPPLDVYSNEIYQQVGEMRGQRQKGNQIGEHIYTRRDQPAPEGEDLRQP